MMINLHKIFITCSGKNANLKYCNKIWHLIKYFLLDSLNWCCHLLPSFDGELNLVR